VFCRQEHHLQEEHLKLLPRRLWAKAEFIIAPATDGAAATRNPDA
jgi:hypothetical protein